MSDDVLVNVEGVSKKFCRSLKRSLWYGLQDVGAEMAGRSGSHDKLRKNEFWAVKDVSFELRRGECLALIGPNGAGKSTLLRMLNGLVKPDKGRISMRGRVGALIELGAGFNPILTGRENIHINGSVLGLTKKEIRDKYDPIVEFAEIEEFIDTPVQNYSSGMRVRLGFAVAAMLDPDIFLIDEVLAVGDVGFRMKCFDHLLRLIEKGTAVIVVSHQIHQLSRITKEALVINRGSLVFSGDLSAGIGAYQKLFGSAREAEELGAPTVPNINSVTLLDQSGEDRTEFSSGETVVARIELGSPQHFHNARLVVSIESPTLGILGSFSSTYFGFQFDIRPEGTSVLLELPEIPLLIGSYLLNISLYGPEITDFLDQRSPAAVFQIVGPETNAFGFGVNQTILFKARWDQL